MGTLEGKCAIVTGAGSGIGAAIARRFVDDGARVVAVDIGDQSELVAELGDKLVPLRADVGDESAVAEMVQASIEEVGRVDVLVNNAGIAGPFVRTHELTTEAFHRTLAVNLLGPFYAIRSIVPHFLEHGGGAIVNVTSISAFPPSTSSADYAASKAALTRLTESVAYEYAADGIRVNSVAPGHIDTPIYAGMEDHKAPMAEKVPMRRFGRPGEVAAVVAMLASDEGSYVQGATIVIDGGRLLN